MLRQLAIGANHFLVRPLAAERAAAKVLAKLTSGHTVAMFASTWNRVVAGFEHEGGKAGRKDQ
ncbi:hypothetical protein WME98_04645 [Sorangium sp. So ce296]|uniref:hypothetical protein n=1 Tax=Sorangium sp. So ce296 TaxID=3133296 RepID=UPI003F5FB213